MNILRMSPVFKIILGQLLDRSSARNTMQVKIKFQSTPPGVWVTLWKNIPFQYCTYWMTVIQCVFYFSMWEAAQHTVYKNSI